MLYVFNAHVRIIRGRSAHITSDNKGYSVILDK